MPEVWDLVRSRSAKNLSVVAALTINTSRAEKALVELARDRGWSVGVPSHDQHLTRDDVGHANASDPDSGPRLMARMAVSAMRALGFDNSKNPAFGDCTISIDRKKVTVKAVLRNSGVLFSPQPNDIRGFGFKENNAANGNYTGHTAKIVDDDTITMTKNDGTAWHANTVMWYNPNGEPDEVIAYSDAASKARTDGTAYETWAPDIFGLGLPIMGGN